MKLFYLSQSDLFFSEGLEQKAESWQKDNVNDKKDNVNDVFLSFFFSSPGKGLSLDNLDTFHNIAIIRVASVLW